MSRLKLSVFQKVLLLLSCITGVLSGPNSPAAYEVNGRTYQCHRVISQDISIVGGGSAGTYAAVRLQALGKAVLLIEQTDRLGGNTQTYVSKSLPPLLPPATESLRLYLPGTSMTYLKFTPNEFSSTGTDYEIVISSMTPSPTELSTMGYVDFNTGQVNLTYVRPDTKLAFQAYSAQAAKYPFLDYGFDLPSPVPEDLLLPLGEFVKKWSLESLVPTLWQNNQGIGNLLQTPTIYVLKYFGNSIIQGFQTGFLTTAAGDNSALYEAASRILDPNVLYSSTILATERETKSGVQIVVKTPTETILVKSKKLILAVQPLLADMAPFDLSASEQSLFAQFKSNEYFAGVLKNTGIPDNISLTNIDASQPYALPQSPNLYSIAQTGIPGFQTVTYLGATNTDLSTSTTNSSNGAIQQAILDGLMKLDIRDTNAKPEFAASSVHAPFELTVSADAIEGGFYGRLYGLQGRRNTWYNSATFHAHDSSLIWRFTEGLLANITAGV
ncbi:Beta-cyclopiazonate dehydrogenase [Lachnellula arida]|uniref:Beta-cyclopiazonate dehydrogenase n=1 Tax=Lachnellula arida TaxID=1316785 RepID=A0A8T9BC38_9HELO|nr:Beta-cyclopiazonate dehydrogenase [Lachnellula arida]